MKRILMLFISLSLLFSFSGCGSEVKNDDEKNENALYSKAISILDELNEDERVEDFRTAYDLLMSLPTDKNKFVSQLEKVEQIYLKYNVELESGDYYLSPPGTFSEESIEKYKSKGVYYDASDLLEAIVYPVLFDKYGDNANCIEGLTYDKVISAIKSTNDYAFDEKKVQFDNCSETWEYIGVPKSKYEVIYHSNGFVESVDIPIVRNENPFSDDEYVSFWDNDMESQKKIAGNRFMNMHSQFSTIFTGYEVLGQIFSAEEIAVISNYIHSLTIDDIWERNFWAYEGEPTTYAIALVIFDYNGKHISIRYGLNDITLKISGNNKVNPLSHHWYTLWCGLCQTEAQEAVIGYDDYINNNTNLNSTVQDYSFDLTANEDKFKYTNNIHPTNWKSNYTNVLNDIMIEFPNYQYSCNYSLYDIDENNIPEMFVKVGTCEADYAYRVFTTLENNNRAILIDTLSASHASICGIQEKGSFLLWGGHMGHEWISKITLSNNNFTVEKIFDAEVVDYHDLQSLDYFELNDRTALDWTSNSFENNQQILDNYTDKSEEHVSTDNSVSSQVSLSADFYAELYTYTVSSCVNYTEWWNNPTLSYTNPTHYYLGKITAENYSEKMVKAKQLVDQVYKTGYWEVRYNGYGTIMIGLYITPDDELYFCYK